MRENSPGWTLSKAKGNPRDSIHFLAIASRRAALASSFATKPLHAIALRTQEQSADPKRVRLQ